MNAPLGAAGGQTSRLVRVEEEGQAAGQHGASICPLIGPCGRVDPAWLAELEFGLFLELFLWAFSILLIFLPEFLLLTTLQ